MRLHRSFTGWIEDINKSANKYIPLEKNTIKLDSYKIKAQIKRKHDGESLVSAVLMYKFHINAHEWVFSGWRRSPRAGRGETEG